MSCCLCSGIRRIQFGIQGRRGDAPESSQGNGLQHLKEIPAMVRKAEGGKAFSKLVGWLGGRRTHLASVPKLGNCIPERGQESLHGSGGCTCSNLVPSCGERPAAGVVLSSPKRGAGDVGGVIRGHVAHQSTDDGNSVPGTPSGESRGGNGSSINPPPNL